MLVKTFKYTLFENYQKISHLLNEIFGVIFKHCVLRKVE